MFAVEATSSVQQGTEQLQHMDEVATQKHIQDEGEAITSNVRSLRCLNDNHNRKAFRKENIFISSY